MVRAVEQEASQVEELRKEARTLTVRKLDYRPCKTVAPLATDGGENRLSFEPLNLEIIRVVDSEGRELIQEIVPISEDDSMFREMTERHEVLRRFLKVLSIEFDDLSHLIGSRQSEETKARTDMRARVRHFRDILEWAVLLDLAMRDWPVDVLLLRDGLLRTKSVKRETLPKLVLATSESGTL